MRDVIEKHWFLFPAAAGIWWTRGSLVSTSTVTFQDAISKEAAR